MAVFVFGAGATRGASFVKPIEHPCLPPLDRDFFTQLQRVQNKKHASLISDVMADVVELFGNNFEVTMEGVFTTLEHTIRMLDTTGETRDFRKAELQEKRDRLVQAIAVVLEDSLTEKDAAGHSKHDPRACDHHRAFVSSVLKAKDSVISFNYDCLLDYALRSHGAAKWNARYGYGFALARGGRLEGDPHWQPPTPAGRENTAHVFKLHGSLHFNVTGSTVRLKQRPYTKQAGSLRFTIIPPEWHKTYDEGPFSRLWSNAADALHGARHVVLVGYSLPTTDLHSTALFRTALKKGSLKSLVVVNPDAAARKRTRGIFQRGLTPKTRILSFDYLHEFVAVPRSTWEV